MSYKKNEIYLVKSGFWGIKLYKLITMNKNADAVIKGNVRTYFNDQLNFKCGSYICTYIILMIIDYVKQIYFIGED